MHNNIGADKKSTVNKGDTIEVDIEDIDTENQRISLSYGLDKMTFQSSDKNGLIKHDSGKKTTSEFGAMLLAAMDKKK